MTYTDDKDINNEPAPWGLHPLNMVAVTSDDPAARQPFAASGMPLQQHPDMRVGTPAAVPTSGADGPAVTRNSRTLAVQNSSERGM